MEQTMSANLYATLIFDYPRDNSFPGCNSTLLDTVEKLDGQTIEVRETRFKFEPRRIRFYVEIFTEQSEFDYLNKPITDEDEFTSYIEDRLIEGGLNGQCTILPDMVNSDIVDKSEVPV